MHFIGGGDGICIIISILCGPKTESPVYLGIRSSHIPSEGSAVDSAEINWSPGEKASGVSQSHVIQETPERVTWFMPSSKKGGGSCRHVLGGGFL